MSPEQERHATQMGFREWTEHYEKEQEEQRSQIGELTKSVSSLSADVRTLVENQRGMFSRMNRPVAPLIIAAFAVLISLSGMFFTLLTLTINPVKENIVHIEATQLRMEEKELALHIMLKEDIEQALIQAAVNEETLRWVEKMEDRYNARLHGD